MLKYNAYTWLIKTEWLDENNEHWHENLGKIRIEVILKKIVLINFLFTFHGYECHMHPCTSANIESKMCNRSLIYASLLWVTNVLYMLFYFEILKNFKNCKQEF